MIRVLHVIVALSSGEAQAMLGDYDGDGKSDILWRNTIAGDVYVYLMNGFAIRTARTVNVVDPSSKIVQ
jgi:FG-GAP repeat.